MFKLTVEQLEKMGAEITTREIKQQPELWVEAFNNYQEKREEIENFIADLEAKHSSIQVILTGAGTSAYVGDTVTPYLKQVKDGKQWRFESIPTTDLVSNPYAFYQKDIPTVLISFARSGNSPESVAAVELGKQIVDDFYQITITCAPEGELAKRAVGDERNLVLLQPARSNDQGFAMTGSYSCMTLTCLLVFDSASLEEKSQWVDALAKLGESVIDREEVIQSYVDLDFDRVIYLGSGSFTGLARETQLKILELTAGKIATNFDSSMGFRHGPKSFVNENSLAFVYVSNNAYTRKYDIDIINELAGDQIASLVVAVGTDSDTKPAEATFFGFDASAIAIPDAYMALPYVMFGQVVSLLSAVKVDNLPDTPSPTGTVNRVVKGVTIHPFEAQ